MPTLRACFEAQLMGAERKVKWPVSRVRGLAGAGSVNEFERWGVGEWDLFSMFDEVGIALKMGILGCCNHGSTQRGEPPIRIASFLIRISRPDPFIPWPDIFDAIFLTDGLTRGF